MSQNPVLTVMAIKFTFLSISESEVKCCHCKIIMFGCNDCSETQIMQKKGYHWFEVILTFWVLRFHLLLALALRLFFRIVVVCVKVSPQKMFPLVCSSIRLFWDSLNHSPHHFFAWGLNVVSCVCNSSLNKYFIVEAWDAHNVAYSLFRSSFLPHLRVCEISKPISSQSNCVCIHSDQFLI